MLSKRNYGSYWRFIYEQKYADYPGVYADSDT